MVRNPMPPVECPSKLGGKFPGVLWIVSGMEAKIGGAVAGERWQFGLVTWAKDYSEFTCVAVTDSGNLGAFSVLPTGSVTKISWRQLESLKKGADDWNQLRVVTVGKRATVYLNEKKVGSFKGKPAEGGS